MSHDRKRRHVLLLTMPAFGHMIPLLELGKKLSTQNDVTLAITKDKADELFKREIVLPEDHLRVYAIEDGYREKDHINLLTHSAFTAMMTTCLAGIEQLVASLPALDRNGEVVEDGSDCPIEPVHVVIVDNFMTSAVAKCREKNIPFYHFNAAATGAVQMWVMIDENWPSIPDPADRNAPSAMTSMILPPQPGEPMPALAEILKTALVKAKPTYEYAAGLILNSMREIEAEPIAFLNTHPVSKHLPVYAVGPLIPAEKPSSQAQADKVQQWLDKQAPNSVIYVSFGSVAWTTPEQTVEIHKALLAIGRPFIWSLPAENQKYLLNTSEKHPDSLILAWAPQKTILNHPATAVFISHCGWNSTVEALSAGVSVVGWAMFADQLLNAKFLEKCGVAVVLEDTGMASSKVVKEAEIVGLVDMVAGWHEGNPFAVAAREWKRKIAASNDSERDLEKLMQFGGRNNEKSFSSKVSVVCTGTVFDGSMLDLGH